MSTTNAKNSVRAITEACVKELNKKLEPYLDARFTLDPLELYKPIKIWAEFELTGIDHVVRKAIWEQVRSSFEQLCDSSRPNNICMDRETYNEIEQFICGS